MAQFNFQAIGTTWRIDIFNDLNVAGQANKEAALLAQIKERIDIFDKAYSRFRADSLVTEMSKKAGTYELPDDADPMMSLYHDLYKKTDGLVTPLIGDLISDAGYDAKYSLQSKNDLKASPAWDKAIEYKPPKNGRTPILIIKERVLLDFGAAGKGYLIDLVGEVLEANGILHYGINAGGDILYGNKISNENKMPANQKADKSEKTDKNGESIQVGLEDPEDVKKIIGVCNLKDGSICGSAGNRRKWGKFTHIINPKTLESPSEIIAVWVTAKTALLADALATCLFFVKAEKLTGDYDFGYILIKKDRSFEKSADFPGELFISPALQSTSH